MPKVTVLLTSYNHGAFIDAAIRSVMNQTFTDWEFLIVDDCSQDDSWERICRYQDPRIHAVRNEVRMGPEHAFRVMDEKATGEYVAVFHSDDMWRPEKLERQVAFLDEHAEIGAVFTGVDIIDETGEVRSPEIQDTYTNCFATKNRTRYEWLNTFFYKGNALCHPSVLIRRQLYRTCGLFLDGLAQGPDLCKWIRLCKIQEIYIMPEKLTCYRVLSGEKNTSANTIKNQRRSYLELMFIYRPYFELTMDDLLRVFPQAQRYVTPAGAEPRFAAARIFLEEGSTDSLKLLALEVLFDLLNDPAAAENLKNFYGYGFPQYVEETRANNVFHILSQADGKLSKNETIFYWRGTTFLPENSVSAAYELSPDGMFELDAELDGSPMDALRIDLCQWHSAIAKVVCLKCDGREYTEQLQSGAQWSGKVDVFACMRPQYFLFFETPLSVRKVHLKAYLGQDLQAALERWDAFVPERDLELEQAQARAEEQAQKKKRGWPWNRN